MNVYIQQYVDLYMRMSVCAYECVSQLCVWERERENACVEEVIYAFLI